MKLSVLVPVYNEERTLEEVVGRVCAFPITKEIILVDDGSKDRSREILERLEQVNKAADDPLNQIRVFIQPFNQGKGAALKTALSHATGDIILIQDADLEYDPKDYPVLLEPIQSGLADVVYGSRFAGGGAHRVLFFWHSVGNRVLTLLSNMLTNLNLSDMEVGYKVFRARSTERHRTKIAAFRLRTRNHHEARQESAAVFTKCRSPTTAAPTKKVRRSPGKTASLRCIT